MNVDMAVNLKSIDSTNVTLSYASFDSMQTEITSTTSTFEAQTISTNKTSDEPLVKKLMPIKNKVVDK